MSAWTYCACGRRKGGAAEACLTCLGDEIGRLHKEEGLTLQEIGERTGYGYVSIWRCLNPERARASAQASNVRRHDTKLQWARDHRPLCECGRPRTRKARRCAECVREARDRERTEFIERWNAGQSNFTIALALNMRVSSVSHRAIKLRAAGHELTYRRADAVVLGKRLAQKRWAA